jgi:hypothetical protein
MGTQLDPVKHNLDSSHSGLPRLVGEWNGRIIRFDDIWRHQYASFGKDEEIGFGPWRF